MSFLMIPSLKEFHAAHGGHKRYFKYAHEPSQAGLLAILRHLRFMLDTNLTLTKQKEDCYKAPVRVSCCLIAFACPSAPARRVDYRDADLRGASPIDVQTLTQAMIGEQAGETSLLGLDFGADPGSPIKFTSTIDLVNMSYSFATVPGSMYEGQALTMKGTGVFDPTTEIMTISSSTTLRSASFTSSGTDTIYLSANPKVDTDDIKYVPDRMTKNGKI